MEHNYKMLSGDLADVLWWLKGYLHDEYPDEYGLQKFHIRSLETIKRILDEEIEPPKQGGE